MSSRMKTLAIAAALTAGMTSGAMAQSYVACPAGYALIGGVCRPAAAPAPGYAYAPNNPVSGAAAGASQGAAAGAAAAGPVGAIVGGALGTATGAVAGTTNAIAGAPVMPAYGSSVPAPSPACGPGYTYYNGACYPAR